MKTTRRDFLTTAALLPLSSRALATLRDPAEARLRKLLSGELCVASAQEAN